MGLLDDAKGNIWSSDFVQKNPRKAYQQYYSAEYRAVSTYLNGGAEPDFSGFSKLGKGLCQLEKARRAGTSPAPPDEPPTLLFNEANLRTGFTTITNVPASTLNLGGTNSPVAGGNDCLIDLQFTQRTAGALLVWGGQGQRIKVVNGWWNINGSRSSGAYARGGIRVRSASGNGPEHISYTKMLIEGAGLADGITVAGSQAIRTTFQEVLVEYPLTDQAEPSEHIDAFQVQGPVGIVEFGRCSIGMCGVVAPGHRGKGLMLNRADVGAFSVILDHVDFFAPNALTGAAIFQAYTAIAINLRAEVYVDKQGPNGNTWSSGSGLFFPQNWTSSGTAPNRIATWPAGANISGQVKEGPPPGGRFVTRASLGL